MTTSFRRKTIGLTLSALAVGSLLGTAPINALAAEWPTVTGAVFAVRDTEIATPFIAFDNKGRDLMAFSFMTRGRSLFGRSYELVCDGGSFHAKDAGTWIGMQVAKSGGFSMEATITPVEAQPKETGVILSFGDDKVEDAALIQDKTGLSLRIAGSKPIALFPAEAGKSVHVLVTCDKGKWAAYLDGKPSGSGQLAAAAPAWGMRELVMGSTWSCTEPWRGRMEGIAVFPRALTAGEVAGESTALKEYLAKRKPAKTLRFQGTLVRQARTSTLEEIRPYTRSLSTAEYKVEKVLAGEWKQPTITVLHWMIMDAKRLPIADRKPGEKVDLKVVPLEENPQLESNRRDEIESDIATDLFYCESETIP